MKSKARRGLRPTRSSGTSEPAPLCTVPILPTITSELLERLDNVQSIDSFRIADKDWRLMVALVKKKQDDICRDKISHQCHKVWQKEKKDREIIDGKTIQEYKNYLLEKRDNERRRTEVIRARLEKEHEMRRAQLVNSILNKEERKRHVLAMEEEKKTLCHLERALDTETRMLLATNRRLQQEEAAREQREAEKAAAWWRSKDAARRRTALQHEQTQRVALRNALSSLESTLLRSEQISHDEARRALVAARIAHTDVRSMRFAADKEYKMERARQVAQYTSQLRNAIRSWKA